MKIAILIDRDRAAYDALAEQYGSVFNRLAWLEMFGNGVQIYGIYDRNNQLIGGFSLYREIRMGMTVYRNGPFTPSSGPFARIDGKHPVVMMSAWKKILALVAEFMETLPYAVISFALARGLVDTQPFIWKKFKVVPRYTYILELDQELGIIRGNMSAERRNDIRKASRDGLVVKAVRDMGIVLALVRQTFARQSMAISNELLRKIILDYANATNSFAHAVWRGERPIAAVFCVHDGDAAYYLLSGYDAAERHRGAGAMAVEAAIYHAKGLGLKRFDFEGSMETAIESYFRGFGARLTPYFRINKAVLPLEMVLKLFKRDLF